MHFTEAVGIAVGAVFLITSIIAAFQKAGRK